MSLSQVGQSAKRFPANVEAVYVLTPMQKALLFHSLAAPAEDAVYFQQLSWVIRSELDVELFREAWIRVVHRHPVLRTFFVWQGRDEPIQCVCERVKVPWRLLDWRDSSGKSPERLTALLEADRSAGFRLNEAPLVRFHLIRLGEQEFQFVWSFHHILMDGWCLPTLTAEAFAIYRSLRDGVPQSLQEPPPYRDFVEWILRQDHSGARVRWRDRLRGFAAATPLRMDRPRSPSDIVVDRPKWIRLSESATGRLRMETRRQRCTLSVLVQAAWALLLRCYSGEQDVVFGLTMAGRPAGLPQVDRMVGLFINTLPVRVRVRSADRCAALLEDLMKQQIEREELSFCSLAEIQSMSDLPPGTALFDSIIVFENYPIDASLRSRDNALAIHDLEFFERTNYPLTLIAVVGDQLSFKLTYDPKRFSSEAITGLGRHFCTLLGSIARTPDARIGDVELMPNDERIAIREMNRTPVDWGGSGFLHVQIEERARSEPDTIALIVPRANGIGDTVDRPAREISYARLNLQANKLAHLLRQRGVQSDQPVGIYVERSAELVIALLAVLKAGGAYVPLDPSYPPERVQFIIADARIRVVVSQEYLASKLGQAPLDVITLDGASAELEAQPEWDPQVPMSPDQLAYIIYTSGSTGQPKGAMNTHCAIMNRLLWMQQAFQLGKSDRVLQKTPFSFDVSVWEFFWPLMVGTQLVIAQPGGHLDPEYLIRTIRDYAVTTVHFVPSMLGMFLDAPGANSCASLRMVICSGEALPFDLERKFFDRMNAQLHNLYGPTEAAIDVTAWQCDAESGRNAVPIGRPIANTEIHVLDRDMQLVPLGIPGELYIGGFNVGRGYCNRPDLTAERFVPDSFSGRRGARLYRTGDLGRRSADGVIEFLDRLDNQVKIRGFRIELGEIETWLKRAPGVKECAVVAVGEDGANRRLIAYLVAAESVRPDVTALNHFLRDRLPDYMVPSAFVFLSNLPLSTNGKLDRRALPKLDTNRPELSERFTMPQSEAERRIADSWREVLRIDKVGIHDNFFELGGNSLLLLPIQGRLQRLFARPIPLLTLFRTPTVHLLAEFLTKEPDAAESEASNEEPGTNALRKSRASNVAQLRRTRLEHRASNSDFSGAL